MTKPKPRKRKPNRQKRFTPESLFRMAADARERAQSLRDLNATQPKPDPDMLISAHGMDLFASIHEDEGKRLRGMR